MKGLMKTLFRKGNIVDLFDYPEDFIREREELFDYEDELCYEEDKA